MTSTPQTRQSFAQLIAVTPALGRIAPLNVLASDLPARTLFHAGPPFEDIAEIPAPVKNSIVAAAVHEGWATTADDTWALVEQKKLYLMPAQDIGMVTPLAYVVGPGVFCIEVCDANAPSQRALSPINDGPLPDALRFGTGRPAGLTLLRTLSTSVGADLSQHVKSGTPLLPMFAHAIVNGDDLHGHVAALQAHVFDMFSADISATTEKYVTDANQFVLNIVMATAALMIGAGAGVSGSDMVVAAGGNGVQLGYKLASAPDTWVCVPAHRPVGPKFPNASQSIALPAIGDSAVIDALGFGAANLRFCPTLEGALDGHIDTAFFTDTAHQAFIGPHPDIQMPGLHVGLDLTRPRTCLGIMLGMVEERGVDGIIGRGVAPWA
tara:strand:- start:35807 stop:36946 length:1140 start_codon:yes stop_codon:yes gene_type:complete